MRRTIAVAKTFVMGKKERYKIEKKGKEREGGRERGQYIRSVCKSGTISVGNLEDLNMVTSYLPSTKAQSSVDLGQKYPTIFFSFTFSLMDHCTISNWKYACSNTCLFI